MTVNFHDDRLWTEHSSSSCPDYRSFSATEWSIAATFAIAVTRLEWQATIAGAADETITTAATVSIATSG